MEHFYTSEENTLILISLLKQHHIKYIIASPGTTNISFVASVQIDPYFQVFSAVDERAAGFMACGLAEESGEPVVITCTGATASRNYIPGLTEAFYRNLPVLAVTYSQHYGRVGNYVAQVIDRTQQFQDMVKKSFQIPMISTEEDRNHTVTAINDALLELNRENRGPVHLNMFTTYSNDFTEKELPQYRVIHRVKDDSFPKVPKGRIGIFVGAHKPFSKEETDAIDNFCSSYDAVVICDQISNYRGKFRFLSNLPNSQSKDLGTREFDLIIYIGYIHGAYINYSGKESWRVNEDGEIRDPNYNLTYVFQMSEVDFFSHYITNKETYALVNSYKKIRKNILSNIPELPFSNMWVAKETSMDLPENSVLYLSILNTLRVWNYFETPKSVTCYSNSGGYGIDGCLSSGIGSAIANKDQEHFIIVGDLSYFYDLDTMFNEIPSNVHIMLINNGVGTEFKNYNHRAAYFKDDADPYIAAKGHNGFKNANLVKSLCNELNFAYYFATSKNEYDDVKDKWLSKSDRPVLLEIFTTDKDESDALYLMNNIIKDDSLKAKVKRSTLWNKAKETTIAKTAKKVLKR